MVPITIFVPTLIGHPYGRSTNGGLLLGSFIGIALGLGLEVRHALAGGGWVDFAMLVGGQNGRPRGPQM